MPAVLKELLAAGKLHGDAMTVTGKTLAENLRDVPDGDREVIRSYGNPMKEAAGYVVMSGNLFDSAVMKISVIDRISAGASCPIPSARTCSRARRSCSKGRRTTTTASKIPTSASRSSRC